MGGKGYREGGEGGQWRLKRRMQDLAFHGDSIQLLGEDQIEKSRIFNVLRFDNPSRYPPLEIKRKNSCVISLASQLEFFTSLALEDGCSRLASSAVDSQGGGELSNNNLCHS